MIDSSDPKRFAETSVELARLLGESKLEKVPLLVFANKQDIATAVSGYEVLFMGVNIDCRWVIAEFNPGSCMAHSAM